MCHTLTTVTSFGDLFFLSFRVSQKNVSKNPNGSPTTRAQNVTYVTYGSQFLIISPPVPNDLTLVRRPRFGEPCSRTLAMLEKMKG